MAFSRRQPNSDGAKDNADAIIAQLKKYGKYIEQKFFSGRADDVNVNYIRNIIKSLILLEGATTDRKVKRKIQTLQNSCYAAITLYKEADNREEYFTKLRKIKEALKGF